MKKAKKDYDGDGKVETGSQEYLGSRDKAIKKAMKKRSVTTEARSNWREDLKEIMGEVEKTEGKKSKSKKKNGICINPDTDEEKNKYEAVAAIPAVASKVIPAVAAGVGAFGTYLQSKKNSSKTKPYNPSSSRKKENLGTGGDEGSGVYDATASGSVTFPEPKTPVSGPGQGKPMVGKVKTYKVDPKTLKNNPTGDIQTNSFDLLTVNAQKIAENLGAELQSLKIEDADGNVAYEVVDLVKPDPMKENVMLTYKSGKGFDAKVGGISARDTVSNVKKAGETIKNIKSDGLVAGVKKTFNKPKVEKPSISSNIDSAIKNYKSST